MLDIPTDLDLPTNGVFINKYKQCMTGGPLLQGAQKNFEPTATRDDTRGTSRRMGFGHIV